MFDIQCFIFFSIINVSICFIIKFLEEAFRLEEKGINTLRMPTPSRLGLRAHTPSPFHAARTISLAPHKTWLCYNYKEYVKLLKKRGVSITNLAAFFFVNPFLVSTSVTLIYIQNFIVIRSVFLEILV